MTNAFKEWTKSKEVCNAFGRLGRRERVGGRFACRNLRKVFPAPCKCVGETHLAWGERQSKAVTAELPEGFLAFCEREVSKMFPVGWDRGYVEEIARHAPPTSACTQKPVKEGGARAASNLDDYLAAVIGEDNEDLMTLAYETPLLYKEVFTSGKLRPLTLTPVQYNVLRPLHKLIFERVARKRWSLTGPPSQQALRRAGFKFKAPILSGDYAGATDGLDLRISRTILDSLLRNAEIVPERVKDRARISLFPTVKLPTETVWVLRGQMMGSLLSFPLLCLYNRLCCLWALGPVPMLINGDDVIAETQDPEPWFRTLPSLSLEPERSKTGYADNKLEINSTPFIIQKGKAIACPVVRTRVLAPRSETAIVGGQFSQFLGGLKGKIRRRAADYFLLSKRDLIRKALLSGLSLSDLGFHGIDAVKHLTTQALMSYNLECALHLPWQVSLPSSQPVGPELISVYDTKAPSAKIAMRKYRVQTCGALFGTTNIEYESSKIRISRWWEDLLEGGPKWCPSLKFRELHARMLGEDLGFLKTLPKKGRLCYGEPHSSRSFLRRLSNRLLHTPRHVEKISVVFSHELPSVVRWGVSIPPLLREGGSVYDSPCNEYVVAEKGYL